MNELAAIRAQRAEVEALLAFRHASGAEKAVAWWRLHRVRGARPGTAPLPALPAPPPGALSTFQSLALRLGFLRLESARPPRHIQRAMRPRQG
ncbi:hypothetical protein [Falsiroseomonas tokyonensis]|uniref:Uncharacterized protein n=1 Tax=Falsiroseomonas tokyonensis TaxID=430521 RepID=A0ABV7BYC3_9PROT|nr:hypothetical protein [Falsiroseomonas tokyonensis]MBU8540264.1 hypothetical protein [Falsiroseomonas tokyonensis]